MKIAILSGKGGTGKTFVATNLAAMIPGSIYVDCDVEEPNGHLFLQPASLQTEEVTVPVPVVDGQLCTACRICVDFCRYNALALIGKTVTVFDDICHACGGCALFCPEEAITEKSRPVGTVSAGDFDDGQIYTGMLNPGEASGVPVIAALLEKALSGHGKNGSGRKGDTGQTVIIDCPPGSACVVMESIKDADCCLLVAEPTIFGAHNLQMVYELVSIFRKPFAVLLNKTLPGAENPSASFCAEHALPIVGSIPYLSEAAVINAQGKLASRQSIQCRELFEVILEKVMQIGGPV